MKKGNAKGKKCNGDNKLIILMIICVLLSLITLAIVAYDKLIKTEGNSCSSDSSVECWSK